MAGKARQAAEAGDRFSRAEAVLDQRPTAIHQRSRDPAAVVSSGVAVPGDKRSGRFERIPVDLIDANPYNARRIYRPPVSYTHLDVYKRQVIGAREVVNEGKSLLACIATRNT